MAIQRTATGRLRYIQQRLQRRMVHAGLATYQASWWTCSGIAIPLHSHSIITKYALSIILAKIFKSYFL
jgi:hypothetical protein